MYEPALHVNGLPLSLTDEHLRDLFAAFGTVVSARLVRDMDGKALGFGIVDMSCAEEVDEILNTKDRIAVSGRRPDIWRVPARYLPKIEPVSVADCSRSTSENPKEDRLLR